MKNPKLVNQIPFREKIGFPVIFNSGFCCPSANSVVGGCYYTRLLEGNVADFLTPL
jgi:hypothetical protein